MMIDWRLTAWMGLAAFVGLLAYRAFVEPIAKPTIRIFMDNSIFCCTSAGHNLFCKNGELVILNASNYIDTKKECNQQ